MIQIYFNILFFIIILSFSSDHFKMKTSVYLTSVYLTPTPLFSVYDKQPPPLPKGICRFVFAGTQAPCDDFTNSLAAARRFLEEYSKLNVVGDGPSGHGVVKKLRHSMCGWMTLDHASMMTVSKGIVTAHGKNEKNRLGMRYHNGKWEVTAWQGNSRGGDITQKLHTSVKFVLHGTSKKSARAILATGFGSDRACNALVRPGLHGRKGATHFVVIDVEQMRGDGVAVRCSADGQTVILPSVFSRKYCVGWVGVSTAESWYAEQSA